MIRTVIFTQPNFFKNPFFLLKSTLFCLFLLSMPTVFKAQTITTDSLNNRISKLEKEVEILKNLKISGFMQFVWQQASAPGIKYYAGVPFPDNVQNRFMIRRGRIRFVYTQKNFTFNFLPDFNERGVVIRDAFANVTEPWLGKFSLQAGLFFRPFSQELNKFSISRETIERARFCEELFPDQRDIGAMLIFKHNGLKLNGGFFNGNAIAADNDSKKDFIGRATWAKKVKINELSFGASVYEGSIRQATKFAYTFSKAEKRYILKDTTSALGGFSRRNYVGADAAFTRNWSFGKMVLNAEVVVGNQVGTAMSSQSPRTAAGLVGNVYNRPFQAGVVSWVQNLGKSNFQTIVRYDWFDGNRKVVGSDLGRAGSQLSTADLKFTTLTTGLLFYWKNLLTEIQYDFVKNEAAPNLKGYETDAKDDVLTIRFQIRF